MIAIGSDHAAIRLKEVIKCHLADQGYETKDVGAFDASPTDYVEYGLMVAKEVASNACDRGIAICGTGVGIGIVCNKVKGIRCVTCSEPYSAKLSRQHNDSNVLSFGARVVGDEMAKMIVDAWLDAEFEGGRHKVRVDKISDFENQR